jgi:pantoate--beta-alanine ligase
VGLEDRFRPHFFDGVATVVSKLFIQAWCDYAMFGEKDYQQLKVVARMARDLDIATTIIAVPTEREPDGLAMSSRNRYLSAEDRKRAPLLYRWFDQAAAAISSGTPRQGHRGCAAQARPGGVQGRLPGGAQWRNPGRATRAERSHPTARRRVAREYPPDR